MNELIDNRHAKADLRRQLLATASALALAGYIASTAAAKAEDRPTVWIELGGQVETVQGTSTPFVAPFMGISPAPDVYANDIFTANQKPARWAFGAEGSLSFQPAGSDWIFSAALKFGRSQTDRHGHQQGAFATDARGFGGHHTFPAAPFADEKGTDDKSHSILDFSAGRDVGLGAFGSNGMSIINIGVRMAQLSSKSDVTAMGRPVVNVFPQKGFYGEITFYNYTMIAHAERSFRGIGPSLSWNASAALVGNREDGELAVDWGINGALLFGRQKTRANHTTQAYHLPTAYYGQYAQFYYARVPQKSHAGGHTSAHNVTVPNLGGVAGLSVKYPNAKFSFGYRADFFFGAIDNGIDVRRTANAGFRGPYATISIGLGG